MEDLESIPHPWKSHPFPSESHHQIIAVQTSRNKGSLIEGLLITIILLFRPNIQALFSGGKRGHKRGAQAT